MKLIVGLGNVGREYENTRHNIGFVAIDYIAKKNNTEIIKSKFGGLFSKININDQQIILLKPQKFMNLSGMVIREYINYFNINIEDILIISDDLDLEIGSYKLKLKGGSGGHNGLKDIECNLNSKDYKRLKIGISNNKQIDTKNYVLGKFTKNDQEKLESIITDVNNIFLDYLVMDFNNLMSKYNRK